MPHMPASLVLLAPFGLVLAALLPQRNTGRRPTGRLWLGRWATLGSLLIAVLAAIACARYGAMTSALIGADGIGLSARLDAISCSMFLLVAFVGVIVVQYSRNYMDGDARQGTFTSGLCLTLAAVMLVVLAGNLVQLVAAWIATSLSLHRLLVFYPERRAARIAARKKFIVARTGDACLAAAALLLVRAFGSTDIATLDTRARLLAGTPIPASLQVAALLIGIAALLKSAQFPSHGWLPEVMETPTPVSALLHAGIINAGGFLMIRLADVMLLSAPVLHFIALIGGFTALFGGVVMLTQTSVKGSLGWSTVAQMGFMTLECGFGAFAIALLHLIAHSLYKAHAFLSAGSTVQSAPPAAITRPRVAAVLASLVLAVGIYAAVGWLFGVFARHDAAVLTLGAVLAMGVGMLMVSALHAGDILGMLARTMLGAAGATIAYFVLERAFEWLTAGILPAIPRPGLAGLCIMGLTIASFGVVTLLQCLVPRWIQRPWWRKVRVHVANGLYVNAAFDRLIGAMRRDDPTLPTTHPI